jgi:hypothetical protein
MARIIKNETGLVSVRLDGAYVSNGKHLVDPYIDDEENKRYFGNFKFSNVAETKALLKKAVKETGLNDTVFYGPYPKWVEDQYGESLAVQNRVKFYKSIKSSEQIENDKVQDYIYSLEVHLKKSKDGGIFLVVARAIATSRNTNAYNDELFEEFQDGDPDEGIEIPDDDLPF